MGYVMVPVPEEHVEEAMQVILRIASRARLKDWDQHDFSALFHDVDEPSRSVISTVARATIAKGSITDTLVAETIEFTQREVLGIVREVNERSQADGHPSLVNVRMDTEVLPNGRTREQRMLSMDPEVALFAREAERLEAQAAPHPVMGEPG